MKSNYLLSLLSTTQTGYFGLFNDQEPVAEIK